MATTVDPPIKPTVVVADDEPPTRGFLVRAISEGGYSVLPAIDVQEAMDQLRQPGVVAAVIDMLFVNSGGLSGLDLLRFIRSEPSTKDLPVIVLTGFRLNETVLSEVKRHGAEFRQKPVRTAELLTDLQRLTAPPRVNG